MIELSKVFKIQIRGQEICVSGWELNPDEIKKPGSSTRFFKSTKPLAEVSVHPCHLLDRPKKGTPAPA